MHYSTYQIVKPNSNHDFQYHFEYLMSRQREGFVLNENILIVKSEAMLPKVELTPIDYEDTLETYAILYNIDLENEDCALIHYQIPPKYMYRFYYNRSFTPDQYAKLHLPDSKPAEYVAMPETIQYLKQYACCDFI